MQQKIPSMQVLTLQKEKDVKKAFLVANKYLLPSFTHKTKLKFKRPICNLRKVNNRIYWSNVQMSMIFSLAVNARAESNRVFLNKINSGYDSHVDELMSLGRRQKCTYKILKSEQFCQYSALFLIHRVRTDLCNTIIQLCVQYVSCQLHYVC